MGFFDNFLGSAFSGVTGLIGGLVSSNQAKKESARNRAFQSLEAEKARQWQSDEWQRQFDATNAYNSPSAQMQRYSEAGLNPNLIYGSLQNASAPSTPSTSSPAGSDASSAVGSAWSNAFNTISSQAMQQAQIDNIRADTDKKESETKGTSLDNELKRLTLTSNVSKARSEALQSTIATNVQQFNYECDKVIKGFEKYSLESMGKERYASWQYSMKDYELNQLIANCNKIQQDANYMQTAESLLGYNAKTQRISANALALNASSYSFLVPYLAKQALSQISLNKSQEGVNQALKGKYNAETEYTKKQSQNYEWNVVKTLLECYSLYKDGKLTDEQITNTILRNFNLSHRGQEEPSKGGVAGSGIHAGSISNGVETKYEAPADNDIELVKVLYNMISNMSQ